MGRTSQDFVKSFCARSRAFSICFCTVSCKSFEIFSTHLLNLDFFFAEHLIVVGIQRAERHYNEKVTYNSQAHTCLTFRLLFDSAFADDNKS